jgi:hypothetical protein
MLVVKLYSAEITKGVESCAISNGIAVKGLWMQKSKMCVMYIRVTLMRGELQS